MQQTIHAIAGCPTHFKTSLLAPSIVSHPAMRRHCEGQLGSYEQNYAVLLYLDRKSAKLKHTNLTTFRVYSEFAQILQQSK